MPQGLSTEDGTAGESTPLAKTKKARLVLCCPAATGDRLHGRCLIVLSHFAVQWQDLAVSGSPVSPSVAIHGLASSAFSPDVCRWNWKSFTNCTPGLCKAARGDTPKENRLLKSNSSVLPEDALRGSLLPTDKYPQSEEAVVACSLPRGFSRAQSQGGWQEDKGDERCMSLSTSGSNQLHRSFSASHKTEVCRAAF